MSPQETNVLFNSPTTTEQQIIRTVPWWITRRKPRIIHPKRGFISNKPTILSSNFLCKKTVRLLIIKHLQNKPTDLISIPPAGHFICGKKNKNRWQHVGDGQLSSLPPLFLSLRRLMGRWQRGDRGAAVFLFESHLKLFQRGCGQVVGDARCCGCHLFFYLHLGNRSWVNFVWEWVGVFFFIFLLEGCEIV